MFVRFRAFHLGVGRYPLEGRKPAIHLLLHEMSAVRQTPLAQAYSRRAGDLGAAQAMTLRDGLAERALFLALRAGSREVQPRLCSRRTSGNHPEFWMLHRCARR
jgi:hypothetical protein